MSVEPSKVIVILGPTASGKTRCAVHLAERIRGEIISADSRQVYRGLDIGSGKDLGDYGDVPYHLIDVRDPGESFSVSDLQLESIRALTDIVARAKQPIICGGTGYYVKALIEDYSFGFGATDPLFTESLECRPRYELYYRLHRMGLWHQHHWEKDSRRRMARAIEKRLSDTNPVSPRLSFRDRFIARLYCTVVDRSILRQRIYDRLHHRLRSGLIEEVSSLLERGIDLDFLQRLGLEYRWISSYLVGHVTYEDMVVRLFSSISGYAKRQQTFIRYLQKSGHRIHDILESSTFIEDAVSWLKPLD